MWWAIAATASTTRRRIILRTSFFGRDRCRRRQGSGLAAPQEENMHRPNSDAHYATMRLGSSFPWLDCGDLAA